ncbi:MAG: hypothetical protein WC468_00420 [Candidatus Paceibacterota bacterium]
MVFMLVYFIPAIGFTLVFAAVMSAIKADSMGKPCYNIVAIALLIIGLPLLFTVR